MPHTATADNNCQERRNKINISSVKTYCRNLEKKRMEDFVKTCGMGKRGRGKGEGKGGLELGLGR